jgi:hypothetical protein
LKGNAVPALVEPPLLLPLLPLPALPPLLPGALVCITRKLCPPASTTEVLPVPLVFSAPTT